MIMFKITLFNSVGVPTTSIFFEPHIFTIPLSLGSSLLKYKHVYFLGFMRHRQLATIPFTLSLDMPELDKRTCGYLPEYIKELQNTVGGEW